MIENSTTASKTREYSVLRKYGLRHAVLAAWEDDLRRQGVSCDPVVGKKLESSRVKISSGCFSVCDVGCELGEVEKILMTVASTGPQDRIGSWLELLAWSMGDEDKITKLLKLEPVRVQYNNCGFGRCGCGH